MKIYRLIIPILFLSFSARLLSAQNLVTPAKIKADMELANRYFMNKWPDPSKNIVTDKVRPANLWTRATYYEGLMALYRLNLDTSLYQYAVDWASAFSWKPTYGSLTTRDGDHQCCGQTYIELYLLDKKAERIQPIKTTIDNMIKTDKIDDWSWIDAIHMSMPVFAKLGAVYANQVYFDRMYAMYAYSKTKHGDAGLFNPIDGLWWRDGNFDPPYTTPAGKMCYWSRGNGWVMAALVRSLDVLPATEAHRKEYLDDFSAMAAALIKIQREDGFWNPSLVDPEDYGGKESSGTAFFVYGLAWGINQGLLNRETYLPAVIKGWNGLVDEALHADGFLGWMQGTGKQPSDGQPLSYDKVPNFEDYGLGAFLLAGSEVYKLSIIQSSQNALPVPAGKRIAVVTDRQKDNLILQYEVIRKGPVTLEIYNQNGQLVLKPVSGLQHDKGSYRFLVSKTALPRGFGYVRLMSADGLDVTRIVCR